MRFYKIAITPLNGGSPIVYSSINTLGLNNGSALRVELDLYEQLFHQTAQNSWVRIYGITYKDISQLANLNPDYANKKFAKIQISVGMTKGLPFANPKQAGLVISGSILQSFANWQGNEISLDLIVGSAVGSPSNPVNLSWNWVKETTLESAIRTTLGTAYPTIPIKGSLSNNLIYTETQPGMYYTLESFSSYVNSVSKTIITTPGYAGAGITINPDGFFLNDGTAPPKKVNIKFTDIIGNLTWLNVSTIQAKLVMRGDLSVGEYVVFPKGSPATNLVNSFSQNRNNISFQGVFQITKLRHLGSSRQADANSWVTVIDCIIPPTLPSGITAKSV